MLIFFIIIIIMFSYRCSTSFVIIHSYRCSTGSSLILTDVQLHQLQMFKQNHHLLQPQHHHLSHSKVFQKDPSSSPNTSVQTKPFHTESPEHIRYDSLTTGNTWLGWRIVPEDMVSTSGAPQGPDAVQFPPNLFLHAAVKWGVARASFCHDKSECLETKRTAWSLLTPNLLNTQTEQRDQDGQV